ncbi:MAG: hypothetical protein ACJ766_12755 [Thermoleophilaceae bacterium]|jgi:hypothetical protein
MAAWLASSPSKLRDTERRSPRSIAARAIVAAKEEREALEEELEELPGWRMRRRTELEERIAAARRRERALLGELGGTPSRT